MVSCWGFFLEKCSGKIKGESLMKKYFLLFLAALISFGATVQSRADARINSMATDIREVSDIDLIWLYPNKVLEYKNIVDFRLGNPGKVSGWGTTEWGGVISDLGDDFGVLGAYINRPSFQSTVTWSEFSIYSPSQVYWYRAGGYKGNHPIQNSQIDILWGKSCSGTDLGLNFTYGDSFGTPLQAQDFGLSIGLGFSNVGAFSQGNIYLSYNMENQTSGATKDGGIYTIKAGTLWLADLEPDTALHLFADLQMDQHKYPGTDFSDTWVLLGPSINHKILGGSGFISTGLLLEYAAENSNPGILDAWNAIWNASVEAKVTDWLTLRSGLNKIVISRVYDQTHTPTYYDDSSDATYRMGFGINWQGFVLDTAISLSSLENSINHAQPGQGLFFAGDIVTVSEADLRYKF
jgi:hypothetical protein